MAKNEKIFKDQTEHVKKRIKTYQQGVGRKAKMSITSILRGKKKRLEHMKQKK